jgi:hypothetical protein
MCQQFIPGWWRGQGGELYAGHLDNSTEKQTEYLGNFWSGKLAEAAYS